MSKKLFCVLLCFALLLSGCVYRSSADPSGGIAVYRISYSTSGTSLVREIVETSAENELLVTVSEALCAESRYPQSVRSLPNGVEIDSVYINKGTAVVDMSAGYLELEGTERILSESAMVLSFCNIDEVCRVDIICEGKIMARGLCLEDFSEADGLCAAYERSVKLYVPAPGGKMLAPVTATVWEDGGACAAQRVMEALLAHYEGMERTTVRSVSVEDGVCSIDLSQEFFGGEPTESGMGVLMIYSIVNSLCRLPGVESVSLSVEGYALESYGGFRPNWPMKESLGLISY